MKKSKALNMPKPPLVTNMLSHETMMDILRSFKIKGSWKPEEIIKHWYSFKKKFPTAKCNFTQWLISYGKVHY